MEMHLNFLLKRGWGGEVYWYIFRNFYFPVYTEIFPILLLQVSPPDAGTQPGQWLKWQSHYHSSVKNQAKKALFFWFILPGVVCGRVLAWSRMQSEPLDMDRWCSSLKCMQHFQKTWVWLQAPMSGSSQPPWTLNSRTILFLTRRHTFKQKQI